MPNTFLFFGRGSGSNHHLHLALPLEFRFFHGVLGNPFGWRLKISSEWCALHPSIVPHPRGLVECQGWCHHLYLIRLVFLKAVLKRRLDEAHFLVRKYLNEVRWPNQSLSKKG